MPSRTRVAVRESYWVSPCEAYGNVMKLISKWMPTAASGWMGSPVGSSMLLLVSLCSVESSFVFSTADAQVVVAGPAGGVRVRAPFVSIDVQSFRRGPRLDVPYAAINTGFYRTYRPVPPISVFFSLPVSYPYAVTARPTYPIIAVPAYPAVVYRQIPSYYEYPRVICPEFDVARQSAYGGVIPSSQPRLELPLPERLRTAAETLARALSLREDGDVWLNYLGLQRIIENVDYGRPASELQDLIINYDGLVSNGTLGAIQYARGFAASRDLLRQYLGTQASSVAPIGEQVPASSRLAPTDSVPEQTLPLPPKNRPLKETTVVPQAAIEQMPVSENGLRAKQIPRLTQASKGEKQPPVTAKVVQPTSL